jgi:hypothetical protein
MSMNVGSKPHRTGEKNVAEAPPPNSGSERSRRKVNEHFAATVNNLPPEAQLKLKAYGDGSPNERARRAIRDGNLEALSLLLDIGFTINAATVMTAMKQKGGEAFRLLLSRVSDLEIPSGPEVDHYINDAVEKGRHDHVESLFKLGVKPTLGMLFSRSNIDREFGKVLVKYWPNPKSFFYDCRSVNTHFLKPYIKLMVDRGADINILSAKGESLLYRACTKLDLECVKEILECGADVNLPSNKGIPPIHAVWAEGEANDPDQWLPVMRLLHKHGADPNAKFRNGDPLKAIANRSRSLICLLGLGMVKDWSHPEKSKLARPAERVIHMELPWIIKGRNEELLGDCVNALIYLLTSKEEVVRKGSIESLLRLATTAEIILRPDAREKVHVALSDYYHQLEEDPPAELVSYFIRHNAIQAREDKLSQLAEAEIRTLGIGGDFRIEGSYLASEHGQLLLDLASAYALHPDEDHMQRVMAILNFVAKTAAETPKSIRIALQYAVVKLLADLLESGVPKLVERASYIRDFLGKTPFALDS